MLWLRLIDSLVANCFDLQANRDGEARPVDRGGIGFPLPAMKPMELADVVLIAA